MAAALISIVPGYISRSVAGSYDNEGKFSLEAENRILFFFLIFTIMVWLFGSNRNFLYAVNILWVD